MELRLPLEMSPGREAACRAVFGTWGFFPNDAQKNCPFVLTSFILDEESQLYYAQRLAKLPETAWYKSSLGHTVFLSHAGTDLDLTKDDLRIMGRQDAYLWDRKHIGRGAPIGKHKGVFQVHGHTPVISDKFCGYNKDMKIETLFYDNHKYCIDMGSFATCKTALIDLDTFETKYFYDEETLKTTVL